MSHRGIVLYVTVAHSLFTGIADSRPHYTRVTIVDQGLQLHGLYVN